MADRRPGYVQLLVSGELERRAAEAFSRMAACTLCARRCGVARLDGEKGACNTGVAAVVCSHHPHYGEEAPLVGRGGSGTIFFSWCNLGCRFCQNCEISAFGEGREVSAGDLVEAMLGLQSIGCHNINFVSPSHVVPQILAGLVLAAEAGLVVPLVYNTGGYDALETLELLDGIVDIYMPDMKFADPSVGQRCCEVPDYPEVNQAAVREMHRQVGDLITDENGVAVRGLLVRHLVLPEGLAGTEEIARFLAGEISPNTYLNVMAQYRPCHEAHAMPPLDRRPSSAEYADAVRAAQDAGLTRLDGRLLH